MDYAHARLLAAWTAAGDTTDAAVARRLGINPATAWRLRKGVSRPSSATLARIERAYGITAAELLPTAETG
ncbi:helix-turn-helix domain-containing protein [Streptomyces sp. NPDC059649]|uniref:helix-turn-helix domain-containing protein n=1 Tax=Streptomyces sp. NPDC059649 TaxID=3346895 RepID=UPI0036A20832